ncbi:UDP-N-acetylmuramoyl-tripeptide--D-alanyl-D-alanine ligase [Candidatus Acetothermia bacterium]|nr:UDP-N-acetylmuramoyl-tripeptide--D-alanyl-D-alanine ligase [Candidatus Acetothermia bacterium]MBI3642500.1 UDP-N-acetylmuramoyl-tripeptide--D-alanyl-D-alanine ligase [Candidatus Acetothermia bacterium]
MWSVEKIAQWVQGQVYRPDPAKKITGFSIDSRTIKRGEFFVAVRGAQTDGYFFLEDAFQRGASGALVEQLPEETRGLCTNLIQVQDSRRALQSLASSYRTCLNIPVIAVTGSSGKTTTKELIYAILAKHFRAYRSPGNFNTEIGLPLALLSMPPSAEVGIFELGLQHPGDIEALCKILTPTIGVITSIGEAHLEYFAGLDALANEKWQLAEFIAAHGAALFLNVDSTPLSERAKKIGLSRSAQLLGFGIQDDAAALRAENIEDVTLAGLRFEICTPDKKIPIQSRLLGRANAYAILAAAGTALYLDVPEEVIQRAVREFEPVQHRMELKESKRFGWVIDDSYNANPSSTREAIRALSRFETPLQKILIIGDMLELGDSAMELHRALADEVKKRDIKLLFTFGDSAAGLSRVLAAKRDWSSKRAIHCTSQEELFKRLENLLTNHQNLILVKGSRGMQLDQLVERLVES